MNRETKKIITKGGVEVELYSYMTGKEAREMQKIIYSHAKFEADDSAKGGKFAGFDASAVMEAEEYAIKVLVVSVGGSKENAYLLVENMKISEYNEVVKAINEITKEVNEDFLAK